jgi:Xaa-Pro aminopeptidase
VRLGDSAFVLVALGAPEPANDYDGFAQAPSFRWLTGFTEPDAALVIVRATTGALAATLFVPPSEPAREVWTGARAGLAGARAATGLATRPARELAGVLDSLAATGLPLRIVGDLGARAVPSREGALVARLRERHPTLRATEATGEVLALRARKSAAELARLRRAAEVTVRAHREAMRLVAPGLNEFEVQALVEYTFRRHGADGRSFASIVGSGPNSAALHYPAADRPMRAGEVLVLDIGALYAGYAADVTRTLPVSGRFTPEQRAIYQLVRDAQAAAERAAVPGARWGAVSDSASAVLARGLTALGLTDSVGATYDCGPSGPTPRQCPQLGLYYYHGLGHGIGLEVHDPAQFYAGDGTIRPGDAFTIEPGVYVRAGVLALLPETPRNAALAARLRDAVRRHADIGVRIEDDYVVSERGVEWISRAPREAAEVEAAMAEPWRGVAARDSAFVQGLPAALRTRRAAGCAARRRPSDPRCTRRFAIEHPRASWVGLDSSSWPSASSRAQASRRRRATRRAAGARCRPSRRCPARGPRS